MDSYSVNEAAAVLGIPEGRVWELLARGVLAGSTEVGGDMRVMLRGAPLPDAGSAPAPNAFRPEPNGGSSNGGNGGNGHGHAEQTPFRELLTEFRNLTERYGQALLALGESRGEVAALRGRVDLLEARIEHRLPWTEAPPAGWNAEALPEPEQEGGAEPEQERAPDAPDVAAEAHAVVDETPTHEKPTNQVELDAEARAEPGGPAVATETRADELPEVADEDASSAAKRAKAHRSRSREAVSGFAEALARAEDPTTASVGDEEPLPGTEDIANAMAAYRQEVDTGEDHDTADDPAADDASPVVRVGYSTATPEPDWIAEEDLIVVGAATSQAETELDGASHEDAESLDLEPVASVAPVVVDASLDSPVEPAGESERPGELEQPVLSAVAAEPVPEPLTEPDHLATGDDSWADEPEEPVVGAVVTDPIAVGELDPVPTNRTPIEIGAEPPAPDDVALLVGPAAFSEPPQVPREPAFWEAGARARAPFAIPHMNAWESSSHEAVTVATEATTQPLPQPEPVASAPDPSPQATPPVAASAPPPLPDSEIGWGMAPVSEPPVSEPLASRPEPTDSALPAQAPVRPARSTRPRRGATARAIRRLRLLLD